MNMAIVELTKSYAIASFKPHLNYHECHVSLVISQKSSLPLKMYHSRLCSILLRTFPKDKPLVYITKWVVHPLVKNMTCQVEFDNIFPWSTTSRLVDLVRKLQEEFGRNPPREHTDIDQANGQLD